MSSFSRPCRPCSSLLSLSFSPLPAGEWKGDGRGAGGEDLHFSPLPFGAVGGGRTGEGPGEGA